MRQTRLRGFEVAEEALEGLLIAVVVFPVGEVSDVAGAADVGSPGGAGLHDLLIEADGE